MLLLRNENECVNTDESTISNTNVRNSSGININDADAHEHEDYQALIGNEDKGADYPFPVKLHYMLKDAENRGLEDLISWLPDGKGFMIHKQKEAAKHIILRWFRQKSYSSFHRQINLYNFKRIKSGAMKGGYTHKLFVKGDPLLSYGIKRFPSKSATHHTISLSIASGPSTSKPPFSPMTTLSCSHSLLSQDVMNPSRTIKSLPSCSTQSFPSRMDVLFSSFLQQDHGFNQMPQQEHGSMTKPITDTTSFYLIQKNKLPTKDIMIEDDENADIHCSCDDTGDRYNKILSNHGCVNSSKEDEALAKSLFEAEIQAEIIRTFVFQDKEM